MRHLNGWMFFLEADCNTARFDSLRLGNPLRIFLAPEERSDFSEGVTSKIIVAVLHNKTVLYKSRGFDLEKYLGSQANNIEEGQTI